MGVLSDCGGMASAVIIVFSYIVQPAVSFSFTLKALKRLYMADTQDSNLFIQSKQNKKKYSHIFDPKTHPNVSPRS